MVIGDDGFPGTVILVRSRGFQVVATDDETVTIRVEAGEPWDDLVAATIDAGWSGVECLSGIPGSAGATPIQNVGAYGQEVAETITARRGVRPGRRDIVRDAGRRVRLRLPVQRVPAQRPLGGAHASTSGSPGRRCPRRCGTPSWPGPLGVELGDRVPLARAREAVRALRAGKGMVLTRPTRTPARPVRSSPTRCSTRRRTRSSRDRAAGLGEPPSWPGAGGVVKVSAAWLIEQAGFGKGYPAAAGSPSRRKHTLALTNRGDALDRRAARRSPGRSATACATGSGSPSIPSPSWSTAPSDHPPAARSAPPAARSARSCGCQPRLSGRSPTCKIVRILRRRGRRRRRARRTVTSPSRQRAGRSSTGQPACAYRTPPPAATAAGDRRSRTAPRPASRRRAPAISACTPLAGTLRWISAFGSRSASEAGRVEGGQPAARVSERGPVTSSRTQQASRPSSSQVPSTSTPSGASARRSSTTRADRRLVVLAQHVERPDHHRTQPGQLEATPAEGQPAAAAPPGRPRRRVPDRSPARPPGRPGGRRRPAGRAARPR